MQIKKLFPILEWLPSYKKAYLFGDISAGLTVGVMLIPQGIAYAMIANLPPVYGLYAAIVPQIVYAIFGTSRQLAVGPVAMDSLIVAAGISGIAAVGNENYIALAIMLAFMMGALQVAFGFFKLGFLVNFLSKPIISGFTSAAAIIIGLNQLKYILGIELHQGSNIFKILIEVFQKIKEINLPTFFVALGGIFLIKNIKKIHDLMPGAIIAIVISVLMVKYLELFDYGVQIVKEIPQGLPSFSSPDFGIENLSSLFPIALTLALIAFMESISIAKTIHSKHNGEYELDNNQEMIGLGMANIIGSFFGSYPTAGGFSRSAVSDQAGANTNLTSIIAAVLIAFTLLFLTPLFYYLPKAILGSIIIVAVFGLININYPKFLWKTRKEDFLMLLVTFFVTLGLGIKEGIIAGVATSLLALIYRSTEPNIAVLGRLPGLKDFRNVKRFKEIEVKEDILVMRHDAQLYFANISNFVNAVKKEVDLKGDGLKLFVLECRSISNIDATAYQDLLDLVAHLHAKGIHVAFAGLIGPVRDFFFKTGFMDDLGEKHFFIDSYTAVCSYENRTMEEEIIPFKNTLQTNVFKEKKI